MRRHRARSGARSVLPIYWMDKGSDSACVCVHVCVIQPAHLFPNDPHLSRVRNFTPSKKSKEVHPSLMPLMDTDD